MTIEKIEFGYTDIYIEYDENGGKLTISNTDDYNFSNYWGAIGKQTFKDFLIGLDESYFVPKMSGHTQQRGPIDITNTIRNVRRYIREELKDELPWYKFMTAQKELREAISDLKWSYDDRDFVDKMNCLTDTIYGDGLNRADTQEFLGIVEGLCTEPWHFLMYKKSREVLFLEDLLPQLQKYLKSEEKACVIE